MALGLVTIMVLALFYIWLRKCALPKRTGKGALLQGPQAVLTALPGQGGAHAHAAHLQPPWGNMH